MLSKRPKYVRYVVHTPAYLTESAYKDLRAIFSDWCTASDGTSIRGLPHECALYGVTRDGTLELLIDAVGRGKRR